MPLVVHYWADLQSVHGFRCYDNIARTRYVSECMYSLYAWFHLWINVWVADKTVWSLVNTCQPERFRDEHRTHYETLYKCPVFCFTYLITHILYSCGKDSENRWVFRVALKTDMENAEVSCRGIRPFQVRAATTENARSPTMYTLSEKNVPPLLWYNFRHMWTDFDIFWQKRYR